LIGSRVEMGVGLVSPSTLVMKDMPSSAQCDPRELELQEQKQVRNSARLLGSAARYAKVRLAGEGSEVATSKRQVNAYLSRRLRYVQHQERTAHHHHGGNLELLDVVTLDPASGITVTNHFSVYVPLPLRSTVEVHNTSSQDITLRFVSSLVIRCLTLQSKQWWREWRVRFAQNASFREAQWQDRSLLDVGLDNFGVKESSLSNFAISNQGSFSTLGHLPMGALCRTDGTASYLWQIEHKWLLAAERLATLAVRPTRTITKANAWAREILLSVCLSH
jgi:hypothetical protein